MSTGVFTLSTVQMQWKHGRFHYDSAVLRKPLSAIEVLPSDPTQTIELNPLFLIPGQIQQVRITFSAGSDIIKEGTVELVDPMFDGNSSLQASRHLVANGRLEDRLLLEHC